MIRVDVLDDDVWQRTLAAVRASTTVVPTLSVRCGKCGNDIGSVGVVPELGPLFTSSWKAPAEATAVIAGRGRLRRHAFRDPVGEVLESTIPMDPR